MTAIGITAIVVAGIVALAWRALDFADDNPEPELNRTEGAYEFECKRAERFLELSAKEEDSSNFDAARAYRKAAEASFARAEKLR